MKLGFVGVGPHAQRMANAFRSCGAEIVCFDRAQPPSTVPGVEALDGFGLRKSWARQVISRQVDAVICCAPPQINQQIAIECELHQQNCCVSKPFPFAQRFWQATHMSHSLFVDLWRLYSPAWRALKADISHRKVTDIAISFCGDGPVRATHSGLLDYGPHALAFLLDLGVDAKLEWKLGEIDTGKGLRRHWTANGVGSGGESIIVETGNALGELTAERSMMVFVETDDGGQYMWRESGQLHTYEAGGAQLMQRWRDLALHAFCRAFMAGESSDTLRISCEAMRLLSEAGPDGQASPG